MYFEKCYSTLFSHYYISLRGKNEYEKYDIDHRIARYLNKYISISFKEYITILLSCNAVKKSDEYYFKDSEDVDKAMDILNEKYIVPIRLMGVE